MRFRQWWHRQWAGYFNRQAERATTAEDRHRLALGLLEGTSIWNTNQLGVGDESVERFGIAIPEMLDTTHLRLLVDDDLDAPDSPEADHLFWEQSAEDILGDDTPNAG